MAHRLRIRIPAIAAVVFIVAVMVTGGLIYDRNKAIYHRDVDTVTWTLYQYDRSLRDLRLAIWERGDSRLDETLLDFELLYGRFIVLLEGQTSNFLDRYATGRELIDELDRGMQRLDRRFIAVADGDVAYDAALRRELIERLGEAQELSRQLMLHHGRIAAEERSADMGVLGRLYIAVLISILLSLIAGGVLIRALVKEARQHRHKTHLLESQSETLREAYQRMEVANRAKSDFMAIMSHEIRTPLNGVLGMAELLHDEPLSDQGRRQIEGLRDSAAGLRSVINDVLDYTRIEAGHLAVERQPFHLSRMLEQLATGYQTQSRSGVQFLMRAAPALPTWVDGDVHRLRQVLMNLLNNAFKFTESGFVMLRVSDNGDGRLTFMVYDTGCGIAQQDQQRIFEPFAQTDTALSRRHEGAGLGLAICSQLVAAMGGELKVESQPESGSRFWFDLPLPVVAGVEEGAASTGQQEPLESQHVLVVEDNALNRELVAAMLTRLGQTCELVGNGEQALEALGQRRFDLVLMDMQMPVMDGLETTRRWRQHEEALREQGQRVQRLPVIAVTANVMPEHHRACLDAGMDDVIGKPFSRKELSAALRRYSRVHAAPSSADASPSGGDNPGRGGDGRGCDGRASVPDRDLDSETFGGTVEAAPAVVAPMLEDRPRIDETLLAGDTVEELRQVMSPQGLSRMVANYLQRFPERLEQMREALSVGDHQALGQIAHDVKGVSASLGCQALEAQAARVERMANDGQQAELETQLEILARLGPATGQALRSAGLLQT
ncbi:hybrid sensor histidine kinase/response regulator [Halomonas litopenaei]|uniref:histidine kinase n=1 Tax=Halomonas litopenaei TaxID=2109328 RepID=A0ABX5IW67_9GAMM|nr:MULTISPECIES: ATP-binding protein [Halomonas]PTL88893.1 hybrid sensor histidine kinase/response regulator [Halomonas litopenaei]PTL89280.1 hybrid sensor histidine kinase/response regulator [Halomonas sp. SYSU XM8]